MNPPAIEGQVSVVRLENQARKGELPATYNWCVAPVTRSIFCHRNLISEGAPLGHPDEQISSRSTNLCCRDTWQRRENGREEENTQVARIRVSWRRGAAVPSQNAENLEVHSSAI